MANLPGVTMALRYGGDHLSNGTVDTADGPDGVDAVDR